MLQFLVKALLSGVIVACASEAAKRYATVGGLIASLPLVAILSMIWLWRDQPDSAALARLSTSTFWFVLPSLPMFLAIPVLLNRGWSFGLALFLGCALTMGLYALLAWLGPRMGIPL
jgi:F0F1-type ATP synthase assembly protein I